MTSCLHNSIIFKFIKHRKIKDSTENIDKMRKF